MGHVFKSRKRHHFYFKYPINYNPSSSPLNLVIHNTRSQKAPIITVILRSAPTRSKTPITIVILRSAQVWTSKNLPYSHSPTSRRDGEVISILIKKTPSPYASLKNKAPFFNHPPHSPLNLVIHNKAIYYNYDRALAHPPIITRAKHSTGRIKCYAGNWFATAVYKKTYIKEWFYDYDRALAHPPFKTERR